MEVILSKNRGGAGDRGRVLGAAGSYYDTPVKLPHQADMHRRLHTQHSMCYICMDETRKDRPTGIHVHVHVYQNEHTKMNRPK